MPCGGTGQVLQRSPQGLTVGRGVDHLRLASGVGFAVWARGLFGIWYLALVPAVRRRWPWVMAGWNRLLECRWRDPLVGRDVLIGG
jgi:hypothetical protein